ncbi:MAG: hypothetical protein R3346_02360 [Candidatus Spechtbacterales bacterium]|nr:hypothetical protein [Candidatus Spechtbacterales bacterium]
MQKINWKISKEQRPTYWKFVVVLAAALLGIAAYFATVQNYFATAFFGIAPGIFIILATQGPRELRYEINEESAKINNSKYKYKNLEYYALLDDFLVLKPKSAEPAIYMPLPDSIELDKITDILSKRLRESEHEQTFGEVINRILNIY